MEATTQERIRLSGGPDDGYKTEINAGDPTVETYLGVYSRTEEVKRGRTVFAYTGKRVI